MIWLSSIYLFDVHQQHVDTVQTSRKQSEQANN